MSTWKNSIRKIKTYKNGQNSQAKILVPKPHDPKKVVQSIDKKINGCTDWYWQYYLNGIVIAQFYAFTTCSNECQAAGFRSPKGTLSVKTNCGDYGGGDGPNTPPVFGVGISNAIIDDSNFDAFLDYVQNTLGFTVNNPYNTFLTVNSVTYPGQITEIKDADGNIVFSYFSPDNNAGPFEIGREYNIGNDNNATSQPNYQYTNVFGYPSEEYGSNTATYAPAGSLSLDQTDDESNTNLSSYDPELAWWDDNTTSYSSQSLPSWSDIYKNYPKTTSGSDLPAPQVYALVGGAVADAYTNDPINYANACALRISRALNYSRVTIPEIPGVTLKGADNKNYIVSSIRMYDFMKKTFGSGSIILSQSDGGTNGNDFQSHLQGHKGIYIMRPSNPAIFQAYGHCTLYTGADCIGGHNYFHAKGGVERITLWILN